MIGPWIGPAISAASGIFGMFNKNKNPADKANDRLDQIPGQTQQYFQPYSDAGQRQLPKLEDQYNDLMNNPGQKFNDIGQNFQQSPGFKFALQQALQGAGHAAAAGGMAGSPEHEQQNMAISTDLANQDYYNYMKGATGLYGEGLHGAQGMANQGQQAGQNYADLIASIRAQQAKNDYAGQEGRNEQRAGAFSNIGSGLAGFADWYDNRNKYK